MIAEIGSTVKVIQPTKEFVESVTKNLKIPNPARAQALRFGSVYSAAEIPQYVEGYEYLPNERAILVPRSWFMRIWLERFITDQAHEVSLVTSEHIVSWPEHLLDPMEHQLNAMTEYFKVLDAHDTEGLPTDTMIVLPPSGGKTVLGLFLAAQSKLRALAVVPTQEIESAWIKDAKRFFGIPEEKIGKIRAGTVRIGEHLTVGSIQTLMNLAPHAWADKFGLALFDEVHRVPGERFIECLRHANAHVRVGLTATDYRKDGRMPVIRWHLGDNCFKDETPRNSVPLVYVGVITPVNIAPMGKNEDGEDQFDFNRLLSMVTVSSVRNRIIIEVVRKILAMNDGDILITSCRKDHIFSLSTMIEESLGITPVVITGETTNRKAIFAEVYAGKHKITIATQSIMQEGASVPRWHHVISTTPFSDRKTAIQLAGRPVRKPDTGGHQKSFGYFWDIIDSKCSMLRNMARGRYRALKQRLHTAQWYDSIVTPERITLITKEAP